MTTRKTGAGKAAWFAGALCAALAATSPSLAQAASNPADVLAPPQKETFTFTFRSTVEPDGWSLGQGPALELPAGNKWRFTLDIDGLSEERLKFDNLSAGAFFNVTPSIRLGGALSFSGEDSALSRATGGRVDRDVPEVKFESAFKF